MSPGGQSPPEAPRSWQCFVAGRPRAAQTGSVVRAGGRLIPIRRGTAWASLVGLVARTEQPAGAPWGEPVALSLLFILPRPKGRRREHYVATRPDAENLCKGLLDALQGVLYRDDAQIVRLTVEKVYEDDRLSPGVLIGAQTVRVDGRGGAEDA